MMGKGADPVLQKTCFASLYGEEFDSRSMIVSLRFIYGLINRLSVHQS